MKIVNKKKFAVLLCSIVVLAGLFAFDTVGRTGAYFSDSVNNSGQGLVVLKHSSTVEELIQEGKNKVITVKNTGTTDIIVKIMLAYPDGAVTVDKEPEAESFDWTLQDDGWYYYEKVLKAGESSSSILVNVGENAPSYEFDITVMSASERAIYNEDGSLHKPEGWAYVPQGGGQ